MRRAHPAFHSVAHCLLRSACLPSLSPTFTGPVIIPILWLNVDFTCPDVIKCEAFFYVIK